MNDLHSDQGLVAASGLPILHVRRLITWGAVTPSRGGKGVVRGWSTAEVLRVARIAAIFEAGLSLRIAHTLSILIPGEALFTIYNPATDVPEATRRDETVEMKVVIGNGTVVGWQIGDEEIVPVGELENDRSIFVSALDYSRSAKDIAHRGVDPASLSWRHDPELAGERVQERGRKVFGDPTSVLTINLGRASRLAMTRLGELGK